MLSQLWDYPYYPKKYIKFKSYRGNYNYFLQGTSKLKIIKVDLLIQSQLIDFLPGARPFKNGQPRTLSKRFQSRLTLDLTIIIITLMKL